MGRTHDQRGVMQNPAVDVVFGLHMKAEIESGKIGYHPGAAMAGTGDFKITVMGSHRTDPPVECG